MSGDSIFNVIDMCFIDASLRFAALADSSTFPATWRSVPLHLHLAGYAIQQMALEQILGGNHG